jgi:hypothetical protein
MGIMNTFRYAVYNELDTDYEQYQRLFSFIESYKARIQLARTHALEANNQSLVKELNDLTTRVDDVTGKLGSYAPGNYIPRNDVRVGFRTAIRSPEDYLILYAAVKTETMAKAATTSREDMGIKGYFSVAKDLYYADEVLSRSSKKGMNQKERFEQNPLLQLVFNTR